MAIGLIRVEIKLAELAGGHHLVVYFVHCAV
jgi:hypothetical protein